MQPPTDKMIFPNSTLQWCFHFDKPFLFFEVATKRVSSSTLPESAGTGFADISRWMRQLSSYTGSEKENRQE